MRKKLSTVAHGIAMAFAMKMLEVTVACASAVTPTVQSQHKSTTIANRGIWDRADSFAAAKTHQRLRQKCNVTASGYATATAASRGMKCANSQIKAKSTPATMLPVAQNRTSCFLSVDIRRHRFCHRHRPTQGNA